MNHLDTIVIKGDPAEAYTRISNQPWVSGVDVETEDGQTTWQVKVTDEQAAEAQLLRLVQSDEHVTVVEFGRRKYELEEIFMNLVGGDNHG